MIDVRSFPRSRSNPHYIIETLPEQLANYQIGYRHMPVLGAAERSDLEARLTQEADLEFALSRITALKADLSALKPPSQSRPAWLRFSPPVLVALLIASAFLLSGEMRPSSPSDPLRLHASFAEMATERIGDIDRLDALDLSASDLVLVGGKIPNGPEGPLTAWHYRGTNGCALTFVSGSGLKLGLGTQPLARFWTTGERDYAIVANGMDAARFAAIVRYAETRTRGIADHGPRIAMRRSTDTAVRCS